MSVCFESVTLDLILKCKLKAVLVVLFALYCIALFLFDVIVLNIERWIL